MLIGVGGGVITDLTGYVASVYMRGIQFGSTVFFNKITYTLTLYSVPSISAGRIEAKAEYDVEAKMDYLCSNGVIHNLEQGFITVDLAQKDASL